MLRAHSNTPAYHYTPLANSTATRHRPLVHATPPAPFSVPRGDFDISSKLDSMPCSARRVGAVVSALQRAMAPTDRHAPFFCSLLFSWAAHTPADYLTPVAHTACKTRSQWPFIF
jgi:hypothetical protein